MHEEDGKHEHHRRRYDQQEGPNGTGHMDKAQAELQPPKQNRETQPNSRRKNPGGIKPVL